MMASKISGASKWVLMIMIRKINQHYVTKIPYLAVEVRHVYERGIKACNQYVINLVVRLLLFEVYKVNHQKLVIGCSLNQHASEVKKKQIGRIMVIKGTRSFVARIMGCQNSTLWFWDFDKKY